MAYLTFYWKIIKNSVAHFISKGALTRSAALSYYTIFSLPPMLLIVLKTAAGFYDEQRVKAAIFNEMGNLVGQNGAQQLLDTIDRLHIFEPNWWATAVGAGFLVFTATTVFITMQDALNAIFSVKADQLRGSGLLKMVRDRVVSFALLISMAFILLVSLLVDTLLSVFNNYLEAWLGVFSTFLVTATSYLLSLAVITVLFGLIFKFLPDVKLRWRDTWVGAITTAILFSLGKYLIGFYIGNSRVASFYDAAGSVLVVMLWVYYASAIFLFGATFTYVRALEKNHRVRPADYAVRIEQKEIPLPE